MQTLIILVAMLAAAPSANASDVCRPAGPPTDASSEDGNPGAGKALGLNDEPDFLRGAFGELVSTLSRDEDRAPALQDFVGNDCPKASTDE